MTERILGPEGSPRRRRFLWVPMLLIACTTLFVIGSAQAVHDLATGLQLDGNALNTCPTGTDAHFCTSSQQDWQDLFSVANTGGPPPTTQTVTQNSSVVGATGTDPDFTQATFTRDFQSGSSCALNSTSTTFCTGDDTTFATGSKDTLDISGWQCNHDNNVNSKIDIMNAYAATYTNPTVDPVDGTHHKLLYFGMEKNKDNGTNDVGFWFLQGNASCSAPSGHQTWSGLHTMGDVLVVSEFTNGGGISNITAYRWVGGTNPLTQIANATGPLGDCKTAAAGDNLCATTNSGTHQFTGNITTPWLTSDATLGVGTTVVPPNFFEGGIDLTAAFASNGATAPSCFNVFVGDTRSSSVTGSTLFDFARGQFGSCNSTLVTTPKDGSGNAIPAGGLSIGGGSVTARDSAVLNVSPIQAFTGTLSFHLCGPIAAATPPTNCQTGGTAVDAATGVNPVTTNGTYLSAAATITSAGTYCWRANFTSTTTGVPPQQDPSAGPPPDTTSQSECFVVNPVTPLISTSATPTVVLGNPIDDTATLTGTANQPGTPVINPTTAGAAAGGTITFTLYGPSPTAVCTTAIETSVVTVHGDSTATNLYKASNGTLSGTLGSLTPTAVGKYYWIAVYSGNSPNTNGASTSCGDTGEVTTVTDTSSITTDQNWRPQDSATVTTASGNAPSGTVTFTLYENASCTGASKATFTDSTVPYTADNTTVYTATQNICWTASFASNNGVAPSTSNNETSNLTITNNH